MRNNGGWQITTMVVEVGKLNLFEGTEDVARNHSQRPASKRVKRFGKRTQSVLGEHFLSAGK